MANSFSTKKSSGEKEFPGVFSEANPDFPLINGKTRRFSKPYEPQMKDYWKTDWLTKVLTNSKRNN